MPNDSDQDGTTPSLVVDGHLATITLARPRHHNRLEAPDFAVLMATLDHGDAAILKVQHWLQATGARDHAVPALAAQAGLEPRTFLRRFRGATGLRPTEYAQQIRIARARGALESSRSPVERIAWEVGYGDPAAFRKIFQRLTGLPPAEYRRRFGVAGREDAAIKPDGASRA